MLATWGLGWVAHIHCRSWSSSDGGLLSPRGSFFCTPAQRPSSSVPRIACTWYRQCRTKLFLVALAQTRHHPLRSQHAHCKKQNNKYFLLMIEAHSCGIIHSLRTCVNYPDFYGNHQIHVIYCVTLACVLFFRRITDSQFTWIHEFIE